LTSNFYASKPGDCPLSYNLQASSGGIYKDYESTNEKLAIIAINNDIIVLKLDNNPVELT
jgi:hypothetical protein